MENEEQARIYAQGYKTAQEEIALIYKTNIQTCQIALEKTMFRLKELQGILDTLNMSGKYADSNLTIGIIPSAIEEKTDGKKD